MNTITIGGLVSQVISSFKLSGIYITKPTYSNRDKFVLIILHLPLVICFGFFIQTEIASIPMGTVMGINVAYWTGGFVQVMVKLVWLYSNSKGLRQLRDMIVDGTNTRHILNQSQEEIALLPKYTTIVKITTVFYLSLYFIAYLTLFFSPYFYSLIFGKWVNPFGFQIYGLSVTSHPGYDIHLLITQYIEIKQLAVVCPVDLLFYICMAYIAFKCDVCRHYILTLGEEPAETSRVLRYIVGMHIELNSFVLLFRDIFKVAIFLQIILYVFVLVFCLISGPLQYGIIIFALLGQIFISCIFGVLLKYKTEQVRYAFINCNWLTLTRKADRQIYLILLSNSEERIFTIFGTIELSLQTFINICKAIFSYYTFLSLQLKL